MATAEMHKAVERQTPFFEPGFDRPSYVRWLDVMHPFYREVDQVVVASGFRDAFDWAYVPRCGLIEQDLAAIVSRGPASVAGSVAVLDPIRRLRSVGEVAGMLYVIEGSALGGQVLLKVFERVAGVTAAFGGSFFAPHGEETRARWGAFIGLLARLSGDSQASQDAVRGAVTTFETLGRWIDEVWRVPS